MGLLPQQRPRLRDYGIFDYYQPARTVGGDYFDYIALPDGRLAIAIGDVAGKGIPAALWMARLYSATRSHLFSTNGAASALAALNAEIDVDAVGHRFITFLIAILDPERNEVTVANAGHLPILQRSPDGSVSRLGFEYSGLPLGIDPTQTFREMQASVKDDAVLLLHTDGVTDAMNADHETFTRERVETYLAGCDGDAESITKGLIREVRHFQGNVSQADDLCVVCLTHAC